MKLKKLIKNLEIISSTGSLDVEVRDIAYHTNDVKDGSCFVAISGSSIDGHKFVDKAVESGASAIITSKRIDVPPHVTNIVVTDPREALAGISSLFFNNPTSEIYLVGITGTNGKTTISYLLESIWKAAGKKSGVVGTVNYRYGSVKTNPKHTTPESYELQKLFRNMVEADVDVVAVEVSSHSLDQKRVEVCNFNGAVFTNLTQDHLDYHLNMERYESAKALLFHRYMPASEKNDKWAVINLDDEYGRRIANKIPYEVYFYSAVKETDFFFDKVNYSFKGIKGTVRCGKRSITIDSSLIGRHNGYNILASVGTALTMGIELEAIEQGIADLKSVPGRLEPVQNSHNLNVFVDYAHTPDALKNVTTVLKELKPSRLITVFGCGGDRDKTKRPLMGYEAALKSDILIVTSDNPRSENPLKIIEEILIGIKRLGIEKNNGSSAGYLTDSDRGKAIEKAINMATPDDIVLIAGKGHEDYQIIGRNQLSFDDRVEAAKAIERVK